MTQFENTCVTESVPEEWISSFPQTRPLIGGTPNPVRSADLETKTFHIVPPIPFYFHKKDSLNLNHHYLMRKRRSDSFTGKISPEQKQQLIDWLSDHSYTETCELVALPPPDGFGFETSRAVLSRFYKQNFEEVEKRRQDKFTSRAIEHLDHDEHEPGYRRVLAESAELFLHERYHEALSRPLESIDDLKKLVFIAGKIKELKLETDLVAKRRREALAQKATRLLESLATPHPDVGPEPA